MRQHNGPETEVLGVVLVGIAVVTGIDLMENKFNQTIYGDMTVEANKMAGEIIERKSKSSTFGGGKGASYLTDSLLADLG